jgi:hypothetical protein
MLHRRSPILLERVIHEGSAAAHAHADEEDGQSDLLGELRSFSRPDLTTDTGTRPSYSHTMLRAFTLDPASVS